MQYLTHALPVEAACTSPGLLHFAMSPSEQQQQPLSVVPTPKQPSQLVAQPVVALHADGAVLQTRVLQTRVLDPLPQGSTPLPAGLLQLQQEEVAAAAVLPCAEQQTHVAIPTSEQGEARIAATTFTEDCCRLGRGCLPSHALGPADTALVALVAL